MSHAYGKILLKKYFLLNKITKGNEEVYTGVDMTNNEHVAIKIEYKYAREKQMKIEREIYKEFTDAKYVPRILKYIFDYFKFLNQIYIYFIVFINAFFVFINVVF